MIKQVVSLCTIAMICLFAAPRAFPALYDVTVSYFDNYELQFSMEFADASSNPKKVAADLINPAGGFSNMRFFQNGVEWETTFLGPVVALRFNPHLLNTDNALSSFTLDGRAHLLEVDVSLSQVHLTLTGLGREDYVFAPNEEGDLVPVLVNIEYQGGRGASVTLVPEVDSVWLLLVGLGVLGVRSIGLARRRNGREAQRLA